MKVNRKKGTQTNEFYAQRKGDTNYSKEHMPNHGKHQKILSQNEVKCLVEFNSIHLDWIECEYCEHFKRVHDTCIFGTFYTRSTGNMLSTSNSLFWLSFIQHSFQVAAVYHRSTESALLSSHVNHQPRAQFNGFFLFKTGNEKEWSIRLKRKRRHMCLFFHLVLMLCTIALAFRLCQ